jgi:hypothetical protein
MTHRIALFASLLIVAAAPCGAQSPASATTATSETTPPAPASSAATSSATAPAAKPADSATAASSEPSPELLKQARREGFKPKKRNGVTLFCQTSAQLGTRFESETCVDETQLKVVVQQREDQRNVLRQQGACTGSNCKSGP